MTDMSFQEKSLWLMFVGLVVAFGFYFRSVLPPDAADVMPHQVVLFAGVVGLLVAVQIVGHIMIVSFDRRTEADERDRLIALKGTRNGAWVLATGVFVSLIVALLIEGNFAFTHVLLWFWVLAQLVETGSQLFLYRRGA